MGKPEGMKQKKAVRWSKEQLSDREALLERCFPGYFDRKLTMLVLLGTVLFIRGFSAALSGLLQIQSFWQAAIIFAGLFVSWLYYILMIRGYLGWLAVALLILRSGEFVYTLYSSLQFLFYMNFIGICWWVVSMAAILADIVFLLYLIFGKMAKRLKADNRILYSGDEIVFSEEMV